MSVRPLGTLNLAQIQDAIYDWVYSVTKNALDDFQIVWRDQGRTIPPRPFVSLKFISGPSPTDRSGSVFLNAANSPIGVGIQMEAQLSIQVFGNTQITGGPIASQIAMDLNSSLLSQAVLSALNAGGVAIQGVGKPQNLSALEESQYEERAGFELALGLVQNITDLSGTIETVNLEKTVNGDQTDQTVTLP